MSLKVVGDAKIIAKFKRIPGDARSKLRESVGRGVLKLQRHVVQNKLAGQVLKKKTGLLGRSIDYAVADSGSDIAGVVGTNVEYAAKHEYGFKGTETVKAHLRLIKQAFGRQLKTPVWQNVGAHGRKVNLPERSFLRSSLKDLAPELIRDMTKAVGESLK